MALVLHSPDLDLRGALIVYLYLMKFVVVVVDADDAVAEVEERLVQLDHYE